jgi:hypothetical protein
MNINATGLALAALMGSQQPIPNTDRLPGNHSAEPMYALERIHKLDDLTSRPVYVLASKEDQIDAARDGKSADRVSVDISDLLVDTVSCKVDWAVLSVGGFLGIGAKHVLVPFGSLEWRQDSNAFALYVTKDQLKLLPEFDAAKAVKNGIDGVVRSCSVSATSAGFVCPPHSQRPGLVNTQEAKKGAPVGSTPELISGTKFARVSQDYVLSSHLRGVDVYALDEDAGSVQFIALDPTTGAAPFAVISTGGMLGIGENHVMVPTNRLCLVHSLEDQDDDQGRWCVQVTKETLNLAPKYIKPESALAELKGWDASQAFFKEACEQRSKALPSPVVPAGAGA